MYYITFDNDDKIEFNKDNIPNLPYENIKELYLDKLDNYDFIKKCIKLEILDLSNNNLTNLDKDLFSNLPYENIKELNLYNCKLDNYDFIKKCIKLEILDLNNNNLNNLDKDLFKYNTQLQILWLYNNKLTNLDKDLFKYNTQLQSLILSNNNLINLDKDLFSNLTQLKNLYLNNNNLTNINKDLFKYNTQLQNLYLFYNNLNDLDKYLFKYNTQLQELSLSYNKLTNLDKDIFKFNTQLQKLWLNDNNLTLLPISIINLIRLKRLYYENNEIEYIPPNLQRFLNRLNQIDNNLQVYNDSQNVHNHSIQEGIKTSLENILNVPKKINKDKLIQNIINSNISEKSIRLLLEYCQDTSIHTVLEVNFEEALLHILEFINLHCSSNKNEIYSIIDTEIQDSECKCFTGRISRLINCLNGFTDKVQVTIPDNMAISNIIVMIKQNYSGDNEDELKDEVKKELLGRGYDEAVINEYLEFVELD
jgi:Leucine-rich repeat (LRR) protein